MASTFTTNKIYDKQGTGDNPGAWGPPLNTNFDIIDKNLGGSLPLTLSNINVTLSASQAQNLNYILTGTLTGNVQIIWPEVGGIYCVYNNTADAFSVTLKTVAGGGNSLVIPQGFTLTIFTDGTNVYPVSSSVPGNFHIPGNLSLTGNVLNGLNVAGVTAATRLQADEQTLPSTPATDKGLFYADPEHQARFLNDQGVSVILSALGNQVYHARDERPSGTAASSFASGAWGKRTINTEILNQIGAALSNSQITLLAGSYIWLSRAPLSGFAGSNNWSATHKSRIWNHTDSQAGRIGSNSRMGGNVNEDASDSWIFDFLTIAGTKTFELQSWAEVGATFTNGVPASIASTVEVYSEIWLVKVR